MRPCLVTIPISHYGERARWALDHAEIAYDEVHHLQMFSWVVAVQAGRSKTLPQLVTDDAVLTDSRDIVRWASRAAPDRSLIHVDPADRAEAERLEARFADVLGVETRRIAYEWFFEAFDAFAPYNAGAAPRWQVATLNVARPVAIPFARRYLGVRPRETMRARASVDREMDEVAARLADGRRFLVGERFSSADLTFAAMAAPMVIPPRYGVPLPALHELPAHAREEVERMRAHPAGAFALRLYEGRPVPRRRLTRPLAVATR
jgi:glutathione S-transferase